MRIIFCGICRRYTPHRLTLDSKIWICDRAHEGDGTHCHNCGDELSKEAIKIVEGLGVNQIVCEKCRNWRGIKDISKIQPLIRDTSDEKKGK